MSESQSASASAQEQQQREQEQKEQSRSRFYYQDDNAIEKPFNWGQLARLGKYLKPYRRQMIPVMFAVLASTAARLMIPLILGFTIDRAIGGGRSDWLMYSAAAILILFVVQWWANRLRIRHMNVIGQNVIYDLRSDLFKHIQQLSFRFYDKRPAGSILVRITNDVNAMQELFTNGVINLIIDMVQLAGIVVLLLVLNFKLGLAVMVTVPIMFVASTALRKRIRLAWQVVRIQQSRINSHLAESIQGIRVTQTFTQERENMTFFEGMNNRNRRAWNTASAVNQSLGPVIELTSAVGTCILFWYGSYLIQTEALTVGLLFAFANYIGNFWEPINRLGQMYSQLLIAMASSERIFEFFDEKANVSERPDAYELPPVRGDIKFDNLVFEYEKNRPALRGIELDVKAGQSIALVGHTGSGKSTIINLLCRFYDPVQGRVTIDGHDLRNVTLQSLRSQVGIVLQDTFIFSGTIRDNIRYGKLNATDAEVEAAARAVHAHDFIMSLPRGYDTEVEERGSVLSMGQRQLLSFARALLADPRILILDEATASIDTETEVRIQEALKALLVGRTSFIIAHRLSTIRGADRIVVLDHGRLMEAGTHEELMLRDNGIYHGLIAAQYRFLQDVG